MNHVPDPLKHKFVSFAKSLFRILAAWSIICSEFPAAGLLLMFAELLGVAEELV